MARGDAQGVPLGDAVAGRHPPHRLAGGQGLGDGAVAQAALAGLRHVDVLAAEGVAQGQGGVVADDQGDLVQHGIAPDAHAMVLRRRPTMPVDVRMRRRMRGARA